MALTFLVTDWTGSYTRAGLVAAALTIGTGIAGPLRGRAADRSSVPKLLILTGACYGGGLCVLAALPAHLWPVAPVVALLTGLSMPPVSQVARSVWARVEPIEARNATYAVESTLSELLFMVGPMLAAFTVAVVDPWAAVVLCGVFAFLGALGFALALMRSDLRPVPTPKSESDTPSSEGSTTGPAPTTERRRFVLREPGLAPTITVSMLLVAALVAVDLVIIAWARERDTPELAGVLVAVWAVGSLAGGLIMGGLPGRPNPVRRLIAVTAGLLLLVPVLPPIWAEPNPWLVGLVLAAGGAAIAPAFGAMNNRLGELAPTGRRAEVFGWMATGSMAGSSLAATSVGWMLDVGSLGAAAGLSAAFGCLAVLVALQIPVAAGASPQERAEDVVS